MPPDAKRELIEPAHPQLSVTRQCALLGLPRATSYYRPYGESMENLQRMRRLDAHYTQTPYDGTRRMTAWLRSQGYAVNRKRVTRLLRTMGVETISPKPHLSQPHPAHRVYPYLLRGVPITRVNQVWSTDTESTEHTRQTTSTHKPFFGVVLHSSDESEGTLRYEVGSFRQAAALVPPPPSTRPCASVLRDRPDIH